MGFKESVRYQVPQVHMLTLASCPLSLLAAINLGAGGVTSVGNRNTQSLSVGGSGTAATLTGVVVPTAGKSF